ELVALLIDSLRALRLTADDFVIRLSSRTAWQEFYASRKGDPERAHEFYQAIDKLEREKEKSDEKLQALGFSLGDVEKFIEAGRPTSDLEAILSNLSHRGLESFV